MFFWNLKNWGLIFLFLIAFSFIAVQTDQGETASWYSKAGPGINRQTANGEVFDDRQLTCATRREAFGTQLRVKNLKNGKSVVCRVNDRGPHKRLKRRIDLTKTAFKKIADSRHGLARVSVTKIAEPKKKQRVKRNS